MERTKLEELFRSMKTVRVLFYLYGNGQEKVYGSKLSYRLNVTLSHIIKVIRKLLDEGYVTKKENGRVKYIELTEKGKRVAKKLHELNEILEK